MRLALAALVTATLALSACGGSGTPTQTAGGEGVCGNNAACRRAVREGDQVLHEKEAERQTEERKNAEGRQREQEAAHELAREEARRQREAEGG